MENDQSDYIQELQFKIIELEQEIDRLKKLNNNQAKLIQKDKGFFIPYGPTCKSTYDPFITEEYSYGDGYEYKKVYDPYTKKERILCTKVPSREYLEDQKAATRP